MLKSFRSKLYQLRKKRWPKTLILCYHRVCDLKADPANITVSKENFLKQIIWLNKNYNIISLDELSDCLVSSHAIKDKSIVITFDDGYLNYIETMELLNHYGIPATFFICLPESKNNFFYWDILSDLLIEEQLINNKKLSFIKMLCEYEGVDIQIESELSHKQFEETKRWNINLDFYPSERCRLYKILSLKAEYESGYSKNNFLKILDSYSCFSNNNFFNSNINFDLGICSIGAHTLNHFCLSKLSLREQEKEILDNKLILEKKMNKTIDYFSYPFGSHEHYNQDSINIVKNNFKLGLANFEGKVHKESNLYELPRYLIRNWNLMSFQNKIMSYFED